MLFLENMVQEHPSAELSTSGDIFRASPFTEYNTALPDHLPKAAAQLILLNNHHDSSPNR